MKDVRGVVAAAVLLAAALAGCSAGGGDGEGRPPKGAPSVTATPAAAESPSGDPAAEGQGTGDRMTPGPELVRDAFAGLQATLQETCTPGAGDCAYYLGRVHEELTGLEASMKNDPKGPGHFPEPLAWMAELTKTLGGDTSTENLEAHMKELIGVRDRINTWMQDHPDDYR